MITLRAAFVLLTLAVAACGDVRQGGAHNPMRVLSVSADGDTAFAIQSGDRELLRARRLAQCTLGEFSRRLGSPPPGQTELMLKVAFHQGGETEHLWMRIHHAEGDSAFVGTIANDPSSIPSLAYGDTARVRAPDVSDWYAVENDTLVAGFSRRVYDRRLGDTGKYRTDSEDAALRRLNAERCE